MKTYPLFDRPAESDFAKFGHVEWRNTNHGEGTFIRAIMSGECRQPNAGEWYLSGGAIIEAYRAPHALQDSFHIAKLVVVERVMIEQIVQT